MLPTCRGPRRALLSALTSPPSRHLWKQPPGTVLQNPGTQSSNPGTWVCRTRAARGADGPELETPHCAPPGKSEVWAPAAARAPIRWGLPGDVAKLDAGPAPVPAPRATAPGRSGRPGRARGEPRAAPRRATCRDPLATRGGADRRGGDPARPLHYFLDQRVSCRRGGV